MSRNASHRHPLASFVALQETLKLDKDDYETQLRRDRQIALDSNAIGERNQLAAWLNLQSNSKTEALAERAVFSWKLSQLFLFVVGTLVGLSICAIALYYDGSKPINIIQAWLVLAGLPLLFLFLWLATVLHFPGIRFLSEALQHSFFQPINHWLARRINGYTLSDSGSTDSESAIDPKLAFSLSSVLMQWFALGIAIGSYIGTAYTLTTSDLAFVWSTSLAIGESEFHQITSILASPFQSWIENSVPTEQLIQSSHYFRYDAGGSSIEISNKASLSIGDPLAHTLTQWWPFLLASIGSYAVAPRLFSLLLALVLSRRALNSAISALPGYSSLLSRMNAPLLSTQADKAKNNSTSTHSVEAIELLTTSIQFDLEAPIVNWGRIDYDLSMLGNALTKRGFTQSDLFHCGGSLSTEEDRITIQKISQLKVDGVLILVKSWEPPLLEFKDWLADLRLNIDGPIVVLLLDPDNTQPSAMDLQLWREDLTSLSDTKLYIETLTL